MVYYLCYGFSLIPSFENVNTNHFIIYFSTIRNKISFFSVQLFHYNPSSGLALGQQLPSDVHERFRTTAQPPYLVQAPQAYPAGLRCTFHSLRHSFATVPQVNDGIKAVQTHLRHYAASFTLKACTHVSDQLLFFLKIEKPHFILR